MTDLFSNIYILVHFHEDPGEDFHGTEWENHMRSQDYFYRRGFPKNFNEVYAQEVVSAAAQCPRKIALLEQYQLDDLANAAERGEPLWLSPGISAEGWELVGAEMENLEDVTQEILQEEKMVHVSVGGYHRLDCVEKVLRACTEAGYVVKCHEAGCLPLSREGIDFYLGLGKGLSI